MACMLENSLNLHTLRSLIEENLHQLEHLTRSQHEISEYLSSEPNDADFAAALSENEISIARKKVRILSAHDTLMESDLNYRNEPLFDKVIFMQKASQLKESTTSTFVAVVEVSAEASVPGEEGAYL